jgi:hypothetical protein
MGVVANRAIPVSGDNSFAGISQRLSLQEITGAHTTGTIFTERKNSRAMLGISNKKK